jgi:hypothetical protein
MALEIWSGPSLFTGDPVVVLATARDRVGGNQKTGPVVQFWILPRDLHPVDASRGGADGAICGACPQRWSLGGGCYVNIHRAPASAWQSWKVGRDDHRRDGLVELALRAWPLRFGAYGDPMAVPASVWTDLLARNELARRGERAHMAYTHGWRLPRAAAYRDFCMASCDTPSDAETARAKGWRFFLTRPASSWLAPPDRTVECLDDARGMQCVECKICDGAGRGEQRASVWITVHGPKQRRWNSLPVLQGKAA